MSKRTVIQLSIQFLSLETLAEINKLWSGDSDALLKRVYLNEKNARKIAKDFLFV